VISGSGELFIVSQFALKKTILTTKIDGAIFFSAILVFSKSMEIPRVQNYVPGASNLSGFPAAEPVRDVPAARPSWVPSLQRSPSKALTPRKKRAECRRGSSPSDPTIRPPAADPPRFNDPPPSK
jgi:hypothetical protein